MNLLRPTQTSNAFRNWTLPQAVAAASVRKQCWSVLRCTLSSITTKNIGILSTSVVWESPGGALCKACMLLNTLPGIQQRTERVFFFFFLQSFWCEEPFSRTSFAGFARRTRLLCSSSSLLATIKRMIFKTNGDNAVSTSAAAQANSTSLPREIKAKTFSHRSS